MYRVRTLRSGRSLGHVVICNRTSAAAMIDIGPGLGLLAQQLLRVEQAIPRLDLFTYAQESTPADPFLELVARLGAVADPQEQSTPEVVRVRPLPPSAEGCRRLQVGDDAIELLETCMRSRWTWQHRTQGPPTRAPGGVRFALGAGHVELWLDPTTSDRVGYRVRDNLFTGAGAWSGGGRGLTAEALDLLQDDVVLRPRHADGGVMVSLVAQERAALHLSFAGDAIA